MGPPIREQVEAMAGLVKAGKIRHYGLSNETAWGLCEFNRVAKELGVPGPVTTQNVYSLLSRKVEVDIAEVLFRENMSLLAYSPLAMGTLTGKYRNGAKPAGARFTVFSDFGMRFRTPLAFEAAEAFCKLAQARGLAPTQLALGYVRSRWFVGSTIIGATTLEQLAEDIDAFVELDAPTLEAIAALHVRYPDSAH